MLTPAQVQELESRAKLSVNEHVDCFGYYEAALATEDDPREQMRLAKAVGFHAREAFEGGMRDPEMLARLLAGVESAASSHSFPSAWRGVAAKIRNALSAARGIVVEVLGEAKGQLSAESGLLALSDGRHAERVHGEEAGVAQMAAGDIAWVATGGDGKAFVTLRVVSGGETTPTDREQGRTDGSSALVVLDVPSGRLVATTPGAKKTIALDVEPGRYMSRCYLISEKYLWIAAKTDLPVGTTAKEIETLEAG